MKKIIAILLALAVVSMAFAQSVWVNNELYSTPEVTIGDGLAKSVWHFRENGDGGLLTDKVSFGATTEDGRASIGGNAWVAINPYGTVDSLALPTEPKTIGVLGKAIKLFGVTPRLQWNNGADAWGKFKLFNNNIEVGIGSDLGTWGWGKGLNWLTDDVSVGSGFLNCSCFTLPGVYVSYIGIDGLQVAAGMHAKEDHWSNKADGWFKKNLYPVMLMASYTNDLFDARVLWKGVFGEDSANNLKKEYSNNAFNVGFTFKGLESLAVGITPSVGFQYESDKSEKTVSKTAVTADVNFNFKNGIQTKPYVTVVFGKDKETDNNYKVLPFSVGNELTYSPNGDCTFKLVTQYAQNGSTKAKKEFGATDKFTSEVRLAPEFSFNLNKSTFSFGVNTNVVSGYYYQVKTDYDWAYSFAAAEKARVRFPIKWTYHF